MSEISRVVLTSLATAAAGTLVFVFGQALQRFVLEPIQEQARVIGRVAFALLAYAELSPERDRPEKLEESSAALRDLAGHLRASLRVIPCYRLFATLRLVQSRARVVDATQELLCWSQAVFGGRSLTLSHRRRLAEQLQIPWVDPPPRDTPSDDAGEEAETHLSTLLCPSEARSLAA